MGLGFIGLKESWEDFMTPNFWRDCLVEFYVTFMLLFFTFMLMADDTNYHLTVALIMGMVVFGNVEAFGHVQWAIMNPVVQVNFMFTKRISFIRCFFYAIFDLLSCVSVAYAIKAILPDETTSKFRPAGPGEGISQIQAMVIEWIVVIFHQTAILGTLDDKNRPVMIPGLTIGCASFAAIAASYKFTGGILNPYAVVHTAILSGDFSTQWIYWTGDMLGGLTALLLYYFSVYKKGIFKKKVKPAEDLPKDDIHIKDKLLSHSCTCGREKTDFNKNGNSEENGNACQTNAFLHD